MNRQTVVHSLFRLGAAVLLVGSLMVGCADANAVNAAFSQARVSWFLFDPLEADGLAPLAGFEQAHKVLWAPRTQAVYATDWAQAPGTARISGVAVSGLGLLLLDDDDGNLVAMRPGCLLPLEGYRTGRLFTWQGKLFLTLFQERPVLTPATLVWWSPDQSRLAPYPIPSQIQDPSRQAVEVSPPTLGSDRLVLVWKQRLGRTWASVPGTFDLATGNEGSDLVEMPPALESPDFDPVRAKLAERLGTGVPSRTVRGEETLLAFTEGGWVSVSKKGGSRPRLYRLPDLGLAGRYTGAAALNRGYVFSWETSYRGFTGAAGLVHVPFAVLAP